MLYAANEAELIALLSDVEPLVVGCYADWCPASSQAKPVFERVAAANEELRFCKVRTDAAPDLAALLRVEAIPSFYLLVGRQIVGVLRGAVSEADFTGWLNDSMARLKR